MKLKTRLLGIRYMAPGHRDLEGGKILENYKIHLFSQFSGDKTIFILQRIPYSSKPHVDTRVCHGFMPEDGIF